MAKTLSLFEEERFSLSKSIMLSAESLCHYGSLYKHWVISFSGGKDSSATVILIAELFKQRAIPQPESLTILYADTRQELPPLHTAALGILEELRQRGFDARVVEPALDHRFFVYMLGRGVHFKPLSISEITQAILDQKLYTFNGQDPKAIVRGAIERKCEGLNRKTTTLPKYFKKLVDGKFELI